MKTEKSEGGKVVELFEPEPWVAEFTMYSEHFETNAPNQMTEDQCELLLIAVMASIIEHGYDPIRILGRLHRETQ